MRWQPTAPPYRIQSHHADSAAPRPPAPAPLPQRHPLTTRRYDHLWHRPGQQLPWVAAQGITTHWLRHTTLTWVERHYGYGIARAYPGHTDRTGATTTYIEATSTSRHRSFGLDRPSLTR